MLLGKLTRLRPVQEGDFHRYCTWLSDAEILRSYMGTISNLSNLHLKELFQWISQSPPNHFEFAIEELESNKHIGNCMLRNIDWRVRNSLIGLYIGDKKYWGKGLGSDALRSLFAYGFDELNLNRISSTIFSNNLRSIKMCLKCGFKEEGTLRESQFTNGRYVDELLVAILRSDYNQDENDF